MKCRHCGTALEHVFADLATSPPSNAYLTAEQLLLPEKYYPLRVFVCHGCWLVQTEDYATADELFAADYAYFSSFSESWLAHSRAYVNTMVERFGIGASSMVIEVAANDGYLLQYVKAAGIPCLGVEPTASTAKAARGRGIEIVERFFGEELATELVAGGLRADLMVANNVLAHVPDINDFVRGFTELLRDSGVATFEFPHLASLIREVQFDTIYHEHFSYLSFTAIKGIFERNGLQVFDVEKLPVHGGSLRVYVQQKAGGRRPASGAVARLLHHEDELGLCRLETYKGFQARAEKIKNDLLRFLLTARAEGKRVAAYGAAAKGNTLLNFAGIRGDLVNYVVDRNPAKQGKFMPGSRIPIVAEEVLKADVPDYVLILPWNLGEEIVTQLAYVTERGGRFVRAVPALTVTGG